MRQLECSMAKAPSEDGPLILSIDSGLHQVMFVNRPGRPVRKAEIDQYSYRFGFHTEGGDAQAEIGRINGRMRVTRKASRAEPPIDTTWTCKTVAAGSKL